MKFQHWLLSCLLLLASAAPMAHAAVSERDWKTLGDGLLTFDDVNNREWLDLSVTQLFQFLGDDNEERLESVLAETADGEMFEGFLFAERNDVIGLAQSAGVDTSSSDFTMNQAAISRLIDLLGPTLVLTGGRELSIGVIDELSANPSHPAHIVAVFDVDPPPDPSPFAGLGFDGTNDRAQRLDSNGVLLYRHVVPEPSALVLGIGALLSLLIAHRCGHRSAA